MTFWGTGFLIAWQSDTVVFHTSILKSSSFPPQARLGVRSRALSWRCAVSLLLSDTRGCGCMLGQASIFCCLCCLFTSPPLYSADCLFWGLSAPWQPAVLGAAVSWASVRPAQSWQSQPRCVEEGTAPHLWKQALGSAVLPQALRVRWG